jgi:hypothetical protein
LNVRIWGGEIGEARSSDPSVGDVREVVTLQARVAV